MLGILLAFTMASSADYYELIGDDNGVFGCMGLLACDNVCPKKLPLQDQLGIMRRMVTMESVRGILPEFIRKKYRVAAVAVPSNNASL